MIKAFAAKIYAALMHKKNQKWINNPLDAQTKVFKELIQKGLKTKFGKDHGFQKVTDTESFRASVPVRDYEELRPYIDQVLEGEADVLWPGRPLYYAKSSGTTSGAKYIPITGDSMPQHIRAAREALLNYIHQTGSTKAINGKHIFLQGSPVLEDKNGVALGRLSGIVAHYVPAYLQKNRMPSWETNCIEDWETKVDAIVDETLKENMTIIGGIPSWVQMYFERLIQKTGKAVGELFPNFSLFVYGGVNFEPYRGIFKKLIGRTPDSIEFYPASEGFFAYQDSQSDKGLLLLLNHGIFYEFIVASSFFEKEQEFHSLEEVQVGVNYVMIISTTAGLPPRWTRAPSRPPRPSRRSRTRTRTAPSWSSPRACPRSATRSGPRRAPCRTSSSRRSGWRARCRGRGRRTGSTNRRGGCCSAPRRGSRRKPSGRRSRRGE